MDLFDAVRKNDHESVKTIIAGGGVDVNALDGTRYSALLYAAKKGFVECGKILLEANANVGTADQCGLTPLHLAAWYGRVECVKVLFRF